MTDSKKEVYRAKVWTIERKRRNTRGISNSRDLFFLRETTAAFEKMKYELLR
jgi:hypothetical protein